MEIDAAPIESYSSIYNLFRISDTHSRRKTVGPNATFEIPANFSKYSPLFKSFANVAFGSAPFEFYSLEIMFYEVFEARIEASRDRLAQYSSFSKWGRKIPVSRTTLLSFRPRVISCHFVSLPPFPQAKVPSLMSY